MRFLTGYELGQGQIHNGAWPHQFAELAADLSAAPKTSGTPDASQRLGCSSFTGTSPDRVVSTGYNGTPFHLYGDGSLAVRQDLGLDGGGAGCRLASLGRHERRERVPRWERLEHFSDGGHGVLL
jgi:hypothetical protein